MPFSRLNKIGQEKVDEYIELLVLSNKYNKDPVNIFGYDNNAYCKKLSLSTAGTSLVSLNKEYPTIKIPKDADLHVFGKVIGKENL